MENKIKFFSCYSINLHRFLRANNLRFISRGENEINGKTFWVYLQDDRMNKVLDAWALSKPIR